MPTAAEHLAQLEAHMARVVETHTPMLSFVDNAETASLAALRQAQKHGADNIRSQGFQPTTDFSAFPTEALRLMGASDAFEVAAMALHAKAEQLEVALHAPTQPSDRPLRAVRQFAADLTLDDPTVVLNQFVTLWKSLKERPDLTFLRKTSTDPAVRAGRDLAIDLKASGLNDRQATSIRTAAFQRYLKPILEAWEPYVEEFERLAASQRPAPLRRAHARRQFELANDLENITNPEPVFDDTEALAFVEFSNALGGTVTQEVIDGNWAQAANRYARFAAVGVGLAAEYEALTALHDARATYLQSLRDEPLMSDALAARSKHPLLKRFRDEEMMERVLIWQTVHEIADPEHSFAMDIDAFVKSPTAVLDFIRLEPGANAPRPFDEYSNTGKDAKPSARTRGLDFGRDFFRPPPS